MSHVCSEFKETFNCAAVRVSKVQVSSYEYLVLDLAPPSDLCCNPTPTFPKECQSFLNMVNEEVSGGFRKNPPA